MIKKPKSIIIPSLHLLNRCAPANRMQHLYYLARMVEAGEDPKFIARRMVIFASEDIGLKDPIAL